MTTLERVSLVVPVRNELPFIDKCLESIAAFRIEGIELEVIAVDGMSTDGTSAQLLAWRERMSNLIVLDNPRKIRASALNIGIRHATGSTIVVLDAHSTYPPNYVSLCLETAKRTGAENVGGIVRPVFSTLTIAARLVAAITTHRFGVGNSRFRTSTREGWVDTVPFGCYRKELFNRIGLFDERLIRTEDNEMNSRIGEYRGKIWLNPEIVILYHNQQSLKGLFRQALRTSRWNAWTWYLAPYAFSPRHAVPGLFAATVILATTLSVALLPIRTLVLCGAIVYGMLALMASFQQAKQYGFWIIPILPVCFFLYHFIYGCGDLFGAISLVLRRYPVKWMAEPWKGAGRFRAVGK